MKAAAAFLHAQFVGAQFVRPERINPQTVAGRSLEESARKRAGGSRPPTECAARMLTSVIER